MAVWFTADSHFGHGGIIAMCERPFASVMEMDEALIANWNSRVRPGDMVWHLGDFAMGHDPETCREIFGRLNGTKFLIKGNHDDERVTSLAWARPPERLVEISQDATRLVMCHYPLRAWRGSMGKTVHLHGHTHRLIPDTTLSCDVGVDSWGYAPVRVAEVKARLAKITLDVEERRELRRRG